jgi:hypothetical protein
LPGHGGFLLDGGLRWTWRCGDRSERKELDNG